MNYNIRWEARVDRTDHFSQKSDRGRSGIDRLDSPGSRRVYEGEKFLRATGRGESIVFEFEFARSGYILARPNLMLSYRVGSIYHPTREPG